MRKASSLGALKIIRALANASRPESYKEFRQARLRQVSMPARQPAFADFWRASISNRSYAFDRTAYA